MLHAMVLMMVIFFGFYFGLVCWRGKGEGFMVWGLFEFGGLFGFFF